MVLLVALTGIGCGGGGNGVDADASLDTDSIDALPAPAMVTIALQNNTPGASSLWHEYNGNQTPDDFGVKLISVFLGENPADPDGTELVYLHPDCVAEAGCGVADVPGVTAVIADYLEIQRPSDQVNQGLGATARQVPPGTYNRLEMRWTREVGDGVNAYYRMDQWQIGVTKEITFGVFATSVVIMSSAIELAPGANVRFALNYNLENMVTHSQSIDGCPKGVDPSCYAEIPDRWFIFHDALFSVSVTDLSPAAAPAIPLPTTQLTGRRFQSNHAR